MESGYLVLLIPRAMSLRPLRTINMATPARPAAARKVKNERGKRTTPCDVFIDFAFLEISRIVGTVKVRIRNEDLPIFLDTVRHVDHRPPLGPHHHPTR